MGTGWGVSVLPHTPALSGSRGFSALALKLSAIQQMGPS